MMLTLTYPFRELADVLTDLPYQIECSQQINLGSVATILAGATPKAKLKKVAQEFFPEIWETPVRPKLVAATELYSIVDALDSLAKDDLERQRFRRFDLLEDVVTADPRLTLGWALYYDGLKRAGKANLVKEWKINEALKCENWYDQLSWISDVAKKNQVVELVDLATIAGYRALLTDEEVEEAAMDWFGVRKEKGDGVGWLDRFSIAVDKVLTEIIGNKTVKPRYSIDEYVNNPILWGTSGAVLYDEPKIKIKAKRGNKIYTAKATKWAAALGMTPADVKNSMLTRKAQYGKPVQKRETKKTRLVMSTDIESFWKMDFVSESFIDPLMAGSPLSTLWMSGKQTREF